MKKALWILLVATAILASFSALATDSKVYPGAGCEYYTVASPVNRSGLAFKNVTGSAKDVVCTIVRDSTLNTFTYAGVLTQGVTAYPQLYYTNETTGTTAGWNADSAENFAGKVMYKWTGTYTPGDRGALAVKIQSMPNNAIVYSYRVDETD